MMHHYNCTVDFCNITLPQSPVHLRVLYTMADNTGATTGLKAVNFEMSGLFVALGVVAILMVMIIPLPTIILDLLLSMNITIGLVILLMSMYNRKALSLIDFEMLVPS